MRGWLRFATIYQRLQGTGVQNVTAYSGNLSEAVGNSIANPLIFQDVRFNPGEAIDPGADRVSAVPVEEACQLVPGARIVAINLTDQPAFFSGAMKCPLLEVPVRLNPSKIQGKALLRGPEFYSLAAAGYLTTERTLASAR